jgi:signal transduction histidine kinase
MANSLRARLFGIVCLSLIAMTVIAWLGISGMRSIRSKMDNTYTNEFIPTKLIADLNAAIITWHRDLMRSFLSEEAVNPEEYVPALTKERDLIVEKLNTIQSMPGLGPDERSLLSGLKDRLHHASSIWEDACELYRNSGFSKAQALIGYELAPVIDSMGVSVDQFVRIQDQQILEAREAAGVILHHRLVQVFLWFAGIILISVLINSMLSGSIISSVSRLLIGIQEVGKGNLLYQVEVKGDDELSRLARAFNQMAQKLQVAESSLRQINASLETQVEERTQELKIANEHLLQEIAERKRAEQLVVESYEKLKLFAYSVVHDLKSPLIGIHGLTKLIEKRYAQSLDEKGREYCNQILRASENISRLVEEINTYIATKEARLEIEDVRMKEMLLAIKEEFAERLRARQILWLESNIPEIIRADRLSILRSVRNFVDNALKYGGETLNQIRITYRESNDFHILSVTDNGIGIQAEDCERLFSPFQRHSTSRGISGSGLGLAIVKEVAKRHGGDAWIEPGGESGVTASISLLKRL